MTTFYVTFEPEHDALTESGTWLAHHLGYIEVSAPSIEAADRWAIKTYGPKGYRAVFNQIVPDLYPLKMLRCVIL